MHVFHRFAAGFLVVFATLWMSAPPPAQAGVLHLIGGDPCQPEGSKTCGDPINISIGNVFEVVIDYETTGANKLAFIRYYNGNPNIVRGLLGNWRTNYQSVLFLGSTQIDLHRPDGKQIAFFLQGGVWKGPANLDIQLTQSGETWSVRDWDDTVMTYKKINNGVAWLASITARNGYTQTLQRNANNQLVSVVDSYGRTLSFAYANASADADVASVTTPDGLVITYSYGGAGLPSFILTRVAYSTTPATSQTLTYEPAANNPADILLTAIADQNGNISRWTYEDTFFERATSSVRGGGADRVTLAFQNPFQFVGDVTVTNAFGQKDIYRFQSIQPQPGIFFPINTQIDRQATSTTAAATRRFTYDANGFLASETDWNGVLTTYVNNSRGLPTKITEAAGTPQQRVKTITYHSTFRLALKVVEPRLTTEFTYDAAGNLVKRSEIDTTSASGQTRTWTFTWSNFLLASATDPRSNKTTYTYDASGALIAVTNARGHKAQVTQHTPGGLPLTIVDANGVTTRLTYDARQRLTSETVDTAGGARTTTYFYDAAGNLVATTLPGGARLTHTYDAANRLVRTTDLFGQRISFTLNALGDPTLTQFSNGAGVTFKRSASYDALGRLKVDTGGAGRARPSPTTTTATRSKSSRR